MSTNLEETYQLKEQRRHILENSDTYVGSVEEDEVTGWVLSGDSMVFKKYKLVPALYKCFDEGMVNCRDHFIRQQEKIAQKTIKNAKPVTIIDININMETGIITLFNNGDGIDVAEHPKHKIYIPEMIFANLMSSTNYNKKEKKIVGGKNGFGVKLIYIYSVWGKVETVDHRRGLKYSQEFTDNLSTIKKPKITKAKGITPYTKVQFKLDFERFGLKGMTEDIVELFRKRAYDMAAVTDQSVSVRFNNELVPVRTMGDYISLYIGTDKIANKRVFENQGRWYVGVCNSPMGEFTHVAFVNGIHTKVGGKHVDYVINLITRKVGAYILAKKKIKVTATSIKEQLMIFINVAIENPSFDSQTKNNLTTPSGKFGSRYEMSDKFIEDIVKKLGVMEAAINITQVKENKKSSVETDGSQTRTIRGIPKLVDANHAGTLKSRDCTLILCEGDSAKAGIMSGLSKEDRNVIGLFPLKGKVMNTSGELPSRINNNAEIAAIKKIMGLKSDIKYLTRDDVNTNLRYGKILFMTDQDLDGSHIKGLCINLFNSQWPELVKIDSFLGYMNTPIIKARRRTKEISFYSDQEYKNWKKKNNEGKGWSIKYFKGLGTSTAKEFKQYFQEKRLITFKHSGEECSDAIDKAFNKKRADDRKGWLRDYDKDAFLDIDAGDVSYKGWTDNELIHFSKYDCDRSIANLVDGNKISTRKILYAAFKRNLTKEVKVAQFSGYVSEHSGYHHGEQSLVGAIIGMAAEYIGTNNISLLTPNGQFGTRLKGGEDHASERYIFTQLSTITKYLYPDADNNILNYKDDDGSSVEPEYYVPIIPMICVNGGKGIGTGFSSDIPQCNVYNIMDYVLYKIGGNVKKCPNIELYYEGFTGTIDKLTETKYLIKGKYEIIGVDIIRITELPIGTWTEKYKAYIEQLMDKKSDKKNQLYIVKSYKDLCTDTTVDFEIKLTSGSVNKLLTQSADYNCNGIEKVFKLYTTKQVTNMWLFNENQQLKKYKTISEIIDAYIPVRLEAYEKRIAYLIQELEREVKILHNKSRFIQEQCDDIIDLRKKKKNEVISLLEAKGYDVIDNDDDFKYLRAMKFEDIEEENVVKLNMLKDSKILELEELRNKTAKNVWITELGVLRKQYKIYITDRKGRQTGALKHASKKKKVKIIKDTKN